jgi:V-type H+-transporting ATPase subunit H
VAIHDCGEYVTHYPYGRKALNELGAKAHIMELMEVRCFSREPVLCAGAQFV